MEHIKTGLKRIEIGALEIHDSMFDMYVDAETKELHILDLDISGTRTVTNSAHGLFFIKIEFHLQKYYSFDVKFGDYEIFLYGTDGVVSRFYLDGNRFGPVDPIRGLYAPFDEVMRERYADTMFKGPRHNGESLFGSCPNCGGYVSIINYECEQCGRKRGGENE